MNYDIKREVGTNIGVQRSNNNSNQMEERIARKGREEGQLTQMQEDPSNKNKNQIKEPIRRNRKQEKSGRDHRSKQRKYDNNK